MPGEDQNILPVPEQIAPLFVDMADPAFESNGQVISFV
jgi:hypothetical protein